MLYIPNISLYIVFCDHARQGCTFRMSPPYGRSRKLSRNLYPTTLRTDPLILISNELNVFVFLSSFQYFMTSYSCLQTETLSRPALCCFFFHVLPVFVCSFVGLVRLCCTPRCFPLYCIIYDGKRKIKR